MTFWMNGNEISEWKYLNVKISPFHTWTKPLGAIVLITNVSFAIPNTNKSKDNDFFANLNVHVNDNETVICVLTKSDVSKQTKIIFGSGQSLFISNKGNRDISICMLLKEVQN